MYLCACLLIYLCTCLLIYLFIYLSYAYIYSSFSFCSLRKHLNTRPLFAIERVVQPLSLSLLLLFLFLLLCLHSISKKLFMAHTGTHSKIYDTFISKSMPYICQSVRAHKERERERDCALHEAAVQRSRAVYDTAKIK